MKHSKARSAWIAIGMLMSIAIVLGWLGYRGQKGDDSELGSRMINARDSLTSNGTPVENSSELMSTDDQVQFPSVNFKLPADPFLADLRRKVIVPWREVKSHSDAFRQQTAISDLSKMRNKEAANILAELLFSDRNAFYRVVNEGGSKSYSVSYTVMIYMEKMLESTPDPVDGRNFGEADIQVWRKWWSDNHDNLTFKKSSR